MSIVDSANVALSKRSRTELVFSSYLLLAVIGFLDHITGFEISFAIFYLAPVALASWFVDRKAGLVISVVSAVVWMVVDLTAGHTYSHPAIPIWNAATRFGFFVITAYLLADVRSLLRLRSLLAQRDSLTDLLNVGAFKSRCDVVFRLADRGRQSLALGYIDLDGFKTVNDELGHGVGDQVLKGVAKTISDRARGSDAVGRLGGDEFAVLLPQTDLDGATAFFTEVHRLLLRFATANGWPVGFSVGVVLFSPPLPTPDRALEIADRQMYEVKRSSKNHVRFLEWSQS